LVLRALGRRVCSGVPLGRWSTCWRGLFGIEGSERAGALGVDSSSAGACARSGSFRGERFATRPRMIGLGDPGHLVREARARVGPSADAHGPPIGPRRLARTSELMVGPYPDPGRPPTGPPSPRPTQTTSQRPTPPTPLTPLDAEQTTPAPPPTPKQNARADAPRKRSQYQRPPRDQRPTTTVSGSPLPLPTQTPQLNDDVSLGLRHPEA
jgi:hypothetical protein